MSIADPAHGGGVFAFPRFPAFLLSTQPDDAPSFLHPAPSWGELEPVLPGTYRALVAGLAQLQDSAPLSWAGLIHRRMRVRGGQVDVPRWSQREAGEWVLTSVHAPAGDSWVVQHDFARRRAGVPLPTDTRDPGRGKAVRLDACDPASATLSTADVACAGLNASQRSGDGEPTHGERFSSLCFFVTSEDVAAWAGATGDDNPIHLLPGAAAGAGLAVGEDEVAAHGLYLAALSLAVVSAEVFDVQLRVPLGVPAWSRSPDGDRGTIIELDSRGHVWSGGHLLLRRRG